MAPSNDRRVIVMFQNTSSNLPAIRQPAETRSCVQQAASPEEPGAQGAQGAHETGCQGSHGAGLLPEQAGGQSVSGPELSHQVSHQCQSVTLCVTVSAGLRLSRTARSRAPVCWGTTPASGRASCGSSRRSSSPGGRRGSSSSPPATFISSRNLHLDCLTWELLLTK